MAVTPITPVQHPQPTERKVTNKKARRLGQALGAYHAYAGGGIGAITGAMSGNPAAAVFGGIGGAQQGYKLGSAMGHKLGGGLERTVTEGAAPVHQQQAQQSPAGRDVTQPNIRLSDNGQQMMMALEITKQLPPELGASHSKSLAAAIMADIAEQNTGGQV